MKPTLALAAALAGVALAALPARASLIIPLDNAGFELPGGTGYPYATSWSGSAARTALYSAFPAARTPGYESLGLGLSFGFIVPSATAGASQAVSTTFLANSTYTFNGYGLNSTDGNDLRFELGYDNGGNFVSLAGATYDLPASWTLLTGVSYTTGVAGAELGQDIVVRLLAVQTTGGTSNGVWFDNVSLSYEAVPEPSTGLLVLLGLGGTLMIRRLRQREALGREKAHMK